MWLINHAGAEQDTRFQALLERNDLRKERSLDLSIAGYDYSVNHNDEALNYILAKLAGEEVGSDTDTVIVLSFIDEWDRTIAAVNSHFTATDGAGGTCQQLFWARRIYQFPRQYLQYRGKAGQGAPRDMLEYRKAVKQKDLSR